MAELKDVRTVAEYNEVQRRRIAESWTEEQERILKVWAEKASGWAWLHDKASRHYDMVNNRYTYPIIALSSISGGLGFVMIGGEGTGSGNTRVVTTKSLSVFVSATHILCAIMTSFQKFRRSGERMETHIHMAKLFSSFSRKIVLELSIRPEYRRQCLDFCIGCKDEYDRLILDSPQIPDYILQQFRKIFHNAEHKPEVANGLIHFHDLKKEISQRSDASRVSIVESAPNAYISSIYTPRPTENQNSPPRKIAMHISAGHVYDGTGTDIDDSPGKRNNSF